LKGEKSINSSSSLLTGQKVGIIGPIRSFIEQSQRPVAYVVQIATR
jgi:hypothetical protein